MADRGRASSEAPTLAQSAIVELGLGVIGLAFIFISGRTISEAFARPVDPLGALALGLAVGTVLGSALGYGVARPAFAERVRPFLGRFTSARPTVANFAILGLAAALGEEILFRAAIQPALGIVIASLLFMLAHSLIADFRHPTPGKLAYAAMAFGMGLVLGVLYDRFGLVASMGAHFAFDTVALTLIRPLLPAWGPQPATAS